MATTNTRTPDWKEMRRRRALEFKRDGWTQQEVADALGVTKVAVSQWMTAVRKHGIESFAGLFSSAPDGAIVFDLHMLNLHSYRFYVSSAPLQNSKHRFISVTVSAPLYSYSMFAGIGHLLARSKASTGLIGVSPSPKGRLAP